MTVKASAGLPEVRTETRVTNAVEAMLLTAKRSKGGAIYFGVPPATAPDLLLPKMEEVPAAPLCANPHGMAAGGTPAPSPDEGAADRIEVQQRPSPSKPVVQVRQDAAIGSLRWLLQGTTGFLPAGRITVGAFDAELPLKVATLAELRNE